MEALPQSVFESETIHDDLELVSKGIACVVLAAKTNDTENLPDLLTGLKGAIMFLAHDCFEAGKTYEDESE